MIIKGSKSKLEGLLKQIELYEDLLELLKEEQELLEAGADTTELKEKQRELRDEIKGIDLEYDLKRSEKLRLITKNDIDKLNKFEPLLKELYQLDQKIKSS
ncbi:MAG: flagellar biosynthesis protein FlgN [Bacillota bacterium]